MARPSATVTLDGNAIAWNYLQVSRGASGQVRVRIGLADMADVPAEDSLVSVAMGRLVSGSPAEFQLVTDGRVTNVGWTRELGGDLLEFLVDGIDGRFDWAPGTDEEYQAPTLSGLMQSVYVDRLGFQSVPPTLPDFQFEAATFPPSQSYHAVMSALVSAFAPVVFVDAELGAIVFYDTHRRLPAGLPARALGVGDFVRKQRTRKKGEIVNAVRVLLYTYDRLTHGARRFDEIEERDPDDTAPDGYANSKTWRRIRRYYDDREHPAVVTDTKVVGVRTLQYGDDGAPVSGLVTRLQLDETGFESLDLGEVTEKYALVALPSGGEQFMQVEESEKRRLYVDNPRTRTSDLVAEYERIEGLVLLDENVPLGVATRAGVVGEDAEQTVEWLPISQKKITYLRSGSGQVATTTEMIDFLSTPVTADVQTTQSYVGELGVSAARDTRTIEITDDESIAKWGRRPERSFDGRVFGETLAREIVDDHILAPSGDVAYEDTIYLVRYDPSYRPGQLLYVTDPDGSYYYLVLDCTDTDSRSDRDPRRWTASTELTAVRVEVA